MAGILVSHMIESASPSSEMAPLWTSLGSDIERSLCQSKFRSSPKSPIYAESEPQRYSWSMARRFIPQKVTVVISYVLHCDILFSSGLSSPCYQNYFARSTDHTTTALILPTACHCDIGKADPWLQSFSKGNIVFQKTMHPKQLVLNFDQQQDLNGNSACTAGAEGECCPTTSGTASFAGQVKFTGAMSLEAIFLLCHSLALSIYNFSRRLPCSLVQKINTHQHLAAWGPSAPGHQ